MQMNLEELKAEMERIENAPVHISFDKTQGPDASVTIELCGDRTSIGAAVSTLLLKVAQAVEPESFTDQLHYLFHIYKMTRSRLKEEANDKETTDDR